jgi:hypothetical protein
MGQRCQWAYDAGIYLGLSSYAFSIRDNTSGISNAGEAKRNLDQLGIPNTFDPWQLFKEEDVIKVRTQVADQLNKVDGRFAQVYQLGLHLGLGWGQGAAPQLSWKDAAVLAKRGFSQAKDDIHNYKIDYLIRAGFDSMTGSLGDSINPAHYDPTVRNRAEQLFRAIEQRIAQEATVP